MKRLLLLAGLMIACTQPAPAPSPSPITTPSANPSASPDASCQDLSHVYHSYRLTVLAQCAHGSGIIEIIRTEADGDYHVLVHMDPNSLDPSGGHWINAANISLQHGDLIAEPVCENPVIQPDAVSACLGYSNPQGPPPPVGTHVEISGPWVLDQTHGWQEIHPVVFKILPALADPLQGSDD